VTRHRPCEHAGELQQPGHSFCCTPPATATQEHIALDLHHLSCLKLESRPSIADPHTKQAKFLVHTASTPHASRPNTLIMAPKKNAAAAPAPSIIPPSTAKPAHGQTSASSQPTKPLPASVKPNSVKSTVRNSSDAQEIALAVWDRYVQDTPQRVKLIDVFMIFLILVGVLQFLYHLSLTTPSSPSMLSSPVSLPPSANSSLPPA
jgi:hypothetical protein